jgi:hypothetical protein
MAATRVCRRLEVNIKINIKCQYKLKDQFRLKLGLTGIHIYI